MLRWTRLQTKKEFLQFWGLYRYEEKYLFIIFNKQRITPPYSTQKQAQGRTEHGHGLLGKHSMLRAAEHMLQGGKNRERMGIGLMKLIISLRVWWELGSEHLPCNSISFGILCENKALPFCCFIAPEELWWSWFSMSHWNKGRVPPTEFSLVLHVTAIIWWVIERILGLGQVETCPLTPPAPPQRKKKMKDSQWQPHNLRMGAPMGCF